jgi:hypothetical protein
MLGHSVKRELLGESNGKDSPLVRPMLSLQLHIGMGGMAIPAYNGGECVAFVFLVCNAGRWQVCAAYLCKEHGPDCGFP